MAEFTNTTWERLRSRLGESMPSHQFHTWIENLQFDRQQQETLQLAAPNYFVKEWVDKNYRPMLTRMVEESIGFRLHLKIVVSDEIPADRGHAEVPDPTPTSTPPGRANGARSAVATPVLRESRMEVQLNRNYTFDHFVVGPCNRVAHAASLAIVENPGHTYNPLFLHGSVGLGKTHLMQAVCHAILDGNHPARIVYLSCERFVNQFIAAIEDGDMETFRYTYRHADVLLIDDIHFLANKERTQDEFFHTFNVLYNAHKQIILSSDLPPKEIPSLSERLVSRFKWGLVSQLQTPSFETRVAILKRKAKLRNREWSDEVAQFVASQIDTNMRELEGAVVKVIGYASLANRDIDVPLVREALSDTLETHSRKITLEHIKDAVIERFGVKLSDLQSKRRHKSISHPRHIAMFLARELTDYSLEEVGGYFGGRDHTTVMYATEKIRNISREDVELMATLEGLTREIKKTQQQ